MVGLPTDIEALKQLEVLDIRGTKLSLHQIRTLTWLKSLRMSLSNFGRGSQTQNQSGNVSSFVSLEEFSIDIDSSLQWWAGNGNIVAEEVATLKKLTSLQFCFTTVALSSLSAPAQHGKISLSGPAQLGKISLSHSNLLLVTKT